MGKIIKLTESDLIKLIKRVINEDIGNSQDSNSCYENAKQTLEKYSGFGGFYQNETRGSGFEWYIHKKTGKKVFGIWVTIAKNDIFVQIYNSNTDNLTEKIIKEDFLPIFQKLGNLRNRGVIMSCKNAESLINALIQFDKVLTKKYGIAMEKTPKWK